MNECKFKVGDAVIIEPKNYNNGVPSYGIVSKVIPSLPYPVHVKIPGKQREAIFTSDGRYLKNSPRVTLRLANKSAVWTVILLYPDYMTDDFGADIYVDSAEADDPYEAVKLVQTLAAEINGSEDIQDFRCIGVIKGEHTFVLDALSF